MKQILEDLLLLQRLEIGNGALPGSPRPEELRQKIPAQVLQHYDRLRTRGKKGVASVRHGVCGHCHMQVAVGLLAMLRRQDNIQQCANCGAYLQFVEEKVEPLAMPSRSVKPGRRGRPRKVPLHAA